jgi:hypothetical protein
MQDDASFTAIADPLPGPGYALLPRFLEASQVRSLQQRAPGRLAAGDFRPATRPQLSLTGWFRRRA